MNLFNALQDTIGTQVRPILAAEIQSPALKSLPRAMATILSVETKPILMLNAFPVTIDPKAYENPLSSGNPNGSLSSLWAFRQLVDPVPTFTRFYNNTFRSTEGAYSLIVKGASVPSNNPYVAAVVAEAQRFLAQSRYANMDETDGTWAPVFATPENWYDTTGNRYKAISFDPNSAGSPTSPFSVLGSEEGGPDEFHVSEGSSAGVEKPLDPASCVNRVAMGFLQVTLARPWLDGSLFSTQGWILPGQPNGFCSSGNRDLNTGILALVPTSILFATGITVDANWSVGDQKVLDHANANGNRVSIGPLYVNQPSVVKPVIQILGWVCSLVPFSPRGE